MDLMLMSLVGADFGDEFLLGAGLMQGSISE